MKSKTRKKRTSGVDDLPTREKPTADWSIDRLKEYARKHLNGSKEYEDQAIDLGRRSVLEFYEAGRALKLIADRLKPEGRWTEWQHENELSTTQVNRAIRLFEEVGGPEELEHFTSVTQALLYYGVEKPRKQRPATPQPRKPDNEDEVDGTEDEDDLDDEITEEDEDAEGEEDEGDEVPEPNGSIEIEAEAGRATITLRASLLGQVAGNEEEKGVLVTSRWDRAAIRAAGCGVPVLVWPEINPDWRPGEGEGR